MLPALVGLAVACWGLALLAWLSIGGLAGLRPWQGRATAGANLLPPARSVGAVLALVLLAFALRAGGLLHPQARHSDHLLNANNVLEVVLGKVYFTEGLPAESGGGQAPYPPGTYLLLAPALTMLMSDLQRRVALVQLGVALLDSLVVGGLWLVLRRAGCGQRAALLGAALYLVPPPMMASLSIGEYANVGGQALALPVVALLALAPLQHIGRVRWLLFVVLLCMALLGHLGVTISLVALLAAVWLLTLLRRQGATLLALTTGGVLAAALIALFYYSAPPFVTIYQQRLAGATAVAAVPVAPLHERLFGVLSRLV
ncbi:MAG: hypothetical protein HC914_17720, partial [Chloroflexaceae bacterium]|nr:hypothetical protein [Chloroflexaceae bacterium]